MQYIIDQVDDQDPEDVLFACVALIVGILAAAPAKRREKLRPAVWSLFKALAEKKPK